MSLINRHEKCLGITLFRFKQFRLEIWFCPKGYSIEEHCHPSQDIELMYLYGEATFCRRRILNWKFPENSPIEMKIVRFPKDIFHRFTVKHCDSHWFSVSEKMLIFLNFQKFLPGKSPISAAIDFKTKKSYYAN